MEGITWWNIPWYLRTRSPSGVLLALVEAGASASPLGLWARLDRHRWTVRAPAQERDGATREDQHRQQPRRHQRRARRLGEQVKSEANLDGRHNDGEGDGLEHSRDHGAAQADLPPVEQGGSAPDHEEREEEERRPRERRWAGDQGTQVELDASGDKEHRNEHAVPDPLEL